MLLLSARHRYEPRPDIKLALSDKRVSKPWRRLLGSTCLRTTSGLVRSPIWWCAPAWIRSTQRRLTVGGSVTPVPRPPVRSDEPDHSCEDPKIVEIGSTPLMWRAYPHSTQFFFYVARRTISGPRSRFYIVSPSMLGRLVLELRNAEVDLVVVHAAPSHRGTSGQLIVRSSKKAHCAANSLCCGVRPARRSEAKSPLRSRWSISNDPAVIARSILSSRQSKVSYSSEELPPDH